MGAASLKEVKIGMREADPLPFDRAPTQKGGAALGAAVAGTPFALEAFEVGIRDGMLNGDDARRDAVILPEGVAIPFGHGSSARAWSWARWTGSSTATRAASSAEKP